MSETIQSQRSNWILPAFLFLVALASQITFTVDVLRDLTGDYPFTPVFVDIRSLQATDIYYAPNGSDIHRNDRVLAVDGRPVESGHDYYQAIRAHRPGDRVRITFDRAGTQLDVAFTLRARYPNGATAYYWFFGGVAWLLMPWLAFAAGYFVVAVRPHDGRAWMVLGILAGFSQNYRPGILTSLGWPEWVAMPAHLYQSAATSAWALCMMLFGFYFPRQWFVDRRYPWIKWILIAPAILIFGWQFLADAATAISVKAAAAVPPQPVPEQYVSILVMVMIGLFFISLSNKFGDPELQADDRRRLKLLYWGCSAAMTPMFLLFLRARIFFHREPGDQDGVWLTIGILGMCLFPVVMGYVILVQQAMPVQVVIRQGMQYALARRGVFVIQFAITVVVISLAVNMASGPGVRKPVQIMFLAGGITVVLRIRKMALRLQGWVDRRFFREAYDADRILGELSEQVRGILDRQSLLQTVANKLSESLHVQRVAVLLESGGCYRPALATGYGATPDVSFQPDTVTVSRLRSSHDPLRVAGERKQPDGEELGRLEARVLLPLATAKELLGFISLGAKRSEEPYSASDTRLLRTVATQTGLALENSRLSEAIAAEVSHRELLNREIEIAREVQQRLFPQNLPPIPALEYAGHCRPASGVGGDYYDFLSLSNGRLGLAIGDVSGKGVPAALLMASLQASVRGQSQAAGRVADLMANVNKLVCDASAENRYATFFYGEFHPVTRRLVYTNGGHNPPMLLRGSEVIRLEVGGPPVGLFRPSRYEQDEITLEAGDILVLFTDGISEAENPAEEEWGEDALISAVRRYESTPPSEMISKILEAADKFAAGAPQHDDMTVVVARCLSK
jgi:sigma-B regulation protein RsbU (phosphoserine phosphatase)